MQRQPRTAAVELRNEEKSRLLVRVRSLSRAGFTTEAVPAKAHDRAKRAAHVIYVASLAVRE